MIRLNYIMFIVLAGCSIQQVKHSNWFYSNEKLALKLDYSNKKYEYLTTGHTSSLLCSGNFVIHGDTIIIFNGYYRNNNNVGLGDKRNLNFCDSVTTGLIDKNAIKILGLEFKKR